MPSELLQSFTVLIAAISALRRARFIARAIGRKPPTEDPSGSTRTGAGRGPVDATGGVLAQSPTPIRPLVAARERPTRRLNLADARKGVGLAAILGPCRAQPLDQDQRP